MMYDRNLCIYMICGFEKSKVRIVMKKIIIKINKDVGLMTTVGLVGRMRLIYGIEKEKT